MTGLLWGVVVMVAVVPVLGVLVVASPWLAFREPQSAAPPAAGGDVPVIPGAWRSGPWQL